MGPRCTSVMEAVPSMAESSLLRHSHALEKPLCEPPTTTTRAGSLRFCAKDLPTHSHKTPIG
jgi:hypothetical protein